MRSLVLCLAREYSSNSSRVPVRDDKTNQYHHSHDLRKSKTFTNLDFLPPKKFKEGDSMSYAGSIRSNRSGISNTAQSAIRMGAGRVSRLPNDTVFTQHTMANELKPQWGMRP